MATKKKPAVVTPAEPMLQFVNLEQITTLPQVRTVFDEEGLEELKASVLQHGILQPVLLRPDPDTQGQYIVIAGERRVRAAHLAGLAAVPALVGQADEAKSAEMQLVENIQREELSLADTAAAVLALYEKHQALKPIAQLTGMSLPWVSKHIAAATKLEWRARRLLESGLTEDLDLILTVNQISQTDKWYPRGDELVEKIIAGQAGRKEARELLAKLREEMAQDKADKKVIAKAKKEGKTGKVAPAEPEWNPSIELGCMVQQIFGLVEEGIIDTDQLISRWTAEQQAKMVAVTEDDWHNGTLVSKQSPIEQMRAVYNWAVHEYHEDTVDISAFILGARSIPLTLKNLAVEIEALAKL